MQRAASAGRNLNKAQAVDPPSPERVLPSQPQPPPPQQRRPLLAPLQARLLLAAALGLLLWFATSLGLLRTSLLQSRRGTGASANACPAHVARQLEWVAGVEAERAALQAEVKGLEAQIEGLRSAAPALPTALAGGNGRLVRPAAEREQQAGGDVAAPFLLVAVLSVAGNKERRDAIRSTWMDSAPKDTMVRFFLYSEEASAEVRREAAALGDIVLVPSAGATDYRSIVFKVLAMVEWVVEHTNPNFVLKTDDDAYVDCAALSAELRHRCRSPDCRNERLYMGEEKRNGEVITAAGNKWSNVEYWEHTGLRQYMPYMFGGGYVFSSDIARALHLHNQIAPLKSMPNEDATFGFWLSGMNLVRVDHSHVKTAAGQCCLSAAAADDVDPRWAAHALRFMEPFCNRGRGHGGEASADWLVLHKVDSEALMRYLHVRLLGCPGERAFLDKAEELGVAAGRPRSVVTPLQLHMLTDSKAGYHFTGDAARSPWSPDGRFMLVMRVRKQPHDLTPESKITIGITRFAEGYGSTLEHTGWEWEEVASTTAWNYHSGPHAQWVGPSSRRLLFNDRDCAAAGGAAAGGGEFCAVIFDISKRKRVATLPRPVLSLSPDGRMGLSVDPARLEASTPGRGYASSTPPAWPDPAWACPSTDGLWTVDVATGGSTLLVSYRALHEGLLPKGSFGGAADAETGLLYGGALPQLLAGGGEGEEGPALELDPSSACIYSVDQAQFAQDGGAIAFRLRITNCTGEPEPAEDGAPAPPPPQHAFFFTIRPDGSGLWRVPTATRAFDSHLDFGPAGRLLLCQGRAAYVIDSWRGVTLLAKPRPLLHFGLGPCRFAPGSTRHVLGETRGGGGWSGGSRVFIWDLERRDAFILGRFATSDWRGPPHARASLQPKWGRDGQHVAVDASLSLVFATGMQVFVLGVQTLQVPPPPARGGQQEAALSRSEAGDPPGAEGGAEPKAAAAVEQAGGARPADKGASGSSSSSSSGSSSGSGGSGGVVKGRALLARRQLLVDLSGPRLSGLRHLLAEAGGRGKRQADGGGLAGWELHLFGMGEAAELAGGAAAALAQAEELGAKVMLHGEEAEAGDADFGAPGSSSSNGTSGEFAAAAGLGPADTDVTDVQVIARILRGERSVDGAAGRSKPRLTTAVVFRLRCWVLGGCPAAGGGRQPGGGQLQRASASAAAAAAAEEEAGPPTVDLSQWLQDNVRPQEGDRLTLALDVDSFLQNGLLRRLVADESISLVSRVLVRWHFRASDWHWMHVGEHALALLGVPWDYIGEEGKKRSGSLG